MHHSSGLRPEDKIRLKKFTKIWSISLGQDFRNSFLMWSTPHALPFFNFLTMLWISIVNASLVSSFSDCGSTEIGSASLARSIRIRFHFRHRTGRIRSVSDHRAGRVWRSRHRSKTPNCLPGARDQVPALFRNAIERRGASVDSNSGAPITQSTFNMLRRMANLLSLLNWWLHRYDNEDDYALFQV